MYLSSGLTAISPAKIIGVLTSSTPFPNDDLKRF